MDALWCFGIVAMNTCDEYYQNAVEVERLMFFYELVPADEAPDENTSTFYEGNTNYRWMKWFELQRPSLTILPVILFFVYLTGSSLAEPQVLRYCLLIYLVAMVVLHLLVFLISFTFPAYKFPEFALTEDRLWFRYFQRWHWLAWNDIQKVSVIRFRGHRTGLLIYSKERQKKQDPKNSEISIVLDNLSKAA